MATIKELETQITKLEEKVSRLHSTNMRMRDDVEELKHNYTNLIKGLNQRLESVDKQFRKA